MPAIHGPNYGKPTLDLNFAKNKSLIDTVTGRNLVTFGRAQANYRTTYVGADGLIKYAAADEPRFDHNPLTGECLGLLVEEQRINNLPVSQGFTSGWHTARAQVTTGQLDPFGETNAILVKQTNGTSSRQYISSLASTNIAANFTVSVFVKYVNYDFVILTGADEDSGSTGDRFGYLLPKLRFQFSTETIAFQESTWSGGATLGYGFKKYANGWYRLWFTRNTALRTNWWGIAVQSNPFVDIGDLNLVTGDGISSVLAFGFQVESGSFPTSYIPTSGSTVTRSADSASITGTNFTSFYNQSEGTWFGTIPTIPNGGRLVEVIGSGSNYSMSIRISSTRVDFARESSSSSQVNTSFPAKISASYSSPSIQGAVNGTLASIVSNGIHSNSMTSVEIGKLTSETRYLGGTISRLTYYPTRLQDFQLQQLTK